MNREELLDSYKGIKNKIQEIFEAQNELQSICNDFLKAQKEEDGIRTTVPVGKMGCVLLAIGYIVGIILCLCLVGLIPFLANFIFLGISFSLLGAFIVPLIIFAIHQQIFKSKAAVESGEKANTYHYEVVVPLANRVNYCKQEIDKLWESKEMIMYEELIPESYRTMDALNFFIESLEKRRADTEKELFNLYEDYLSKQQMLELQSQQLATQIQQLEKQNEQLAATNQANAINQEQLRKLKELKRNQDKLSSQQKYGNVVSTINLLKK